MSSHSNRRLILSLIGSPGSMQETANFLKWYLRPSREHQHFSLFLLLQSFLTFLDVKYLHFFSVPSACHDFLKTLIFVSLTHPSRINTDANFSVKPSLIPPSNPVSYWKEKQPLLHLHSSGDLSLYISIPLFPHYCISNFRTGAISFPPFSASHQV